MRYMVLGNGAAGVTAAQKLRELRHLDEIAIVTWEETPAYTKIMLPDYIGNRLGREKLFIRDEKFYANSRIDLIKGARVKAIDASTKRVSLSEGRNEKYDRLLVATGGIPCIPPIEGLRDAGFFLINSIRDADIIKEKASGGGNAVIIGAGLTGIEMGFALRRLGMDVYIVEQQDTLLPLQLDTYSARVMADTIESEGINLLMGRAVRRVTESAGKCVQLSDGSEIGYSMLIVATGTRPNLEILEGSGIECRRGILVDRYMQSSIDGIYAAGDAAEMESSLSDGYISCYTWSNAMNQGRCAAYSMADQPQEFSIEGAMQNSVQLRDIPFISMGMVNAKSPECETLVYDDRGTRVYKRLVLKDNKIKGMVLIGDTGTANAIGSLIRKGVEVSPYRERLLERDFKV